jgi:hypothetical protein
MQNNTQKGVLTVYIPFFITPKSFLGGKRSVFLRFLKHPTYQSASGLYRALKEGSKYVDTVRNSLNPWTFLARCLWSLAGIESHKIAVYVYTNVEYGVFNEFIANYPRSGEFEIIYQRVNLSELEHPYMLTWAPRKQMQLDIESGNEHSLYLYLEHDIDFRSENLNYFITWRSKLQNGIIPGFMLVEWNAIGKFWSNFQIQQHDFLAGQHLSTDGFRFIPLKQPYCPVLLLDQTLAEEFLQSEFFQIENFREMQSKFGLPTRESAAIGMTYFGKERNYEVRSYVAFQQENRFPVVGAIIRHMPNIYADSETFAQCKNPLLEMWS